MVAPRHLLILILLSLTVAACGRGAPTATATPTPARTSTPIQPTATATLAADLADPELIKGPDGATWAVTSLTNQSEAPVSGVELQYRFFDSDGRSLGRVVTTPNPPILPAGGRADLAGQAPSETVPASVESELLRYQTAERSPIALELELVEVIGLPQGGSRVLGTIGHESNRLLTLDGFSVVVEAEGQITGLPTNTIAANQLPPGEASPWSAEFADPIDPGALSLTAYAKPPEVRFQPCLVELEGDPGLRQDPQGNFFFTGLLQNQEPFSCRTRLLVRVRIDGQLTDLIALDDPIPLAGTEERPIGFRLGQPLDGSEEDIELEPHLESAGARGVDPLTLSLRMTSFEDLGSNLVLRGLLTNDTEATARQPTVFGALRATDGQLLTAGWQAMPADLAAGDSAEFVLLLPISEEMEVNTAEFDLRALALVEGEE